MLDFRRRAHFVSREYESAADFLHALKADKFDWDFAILPDSALEYLRRQEVQLLGNRVPEPIGQIGQSCFELVGVAGLQLKQVERVYHFGGNSSRAALRNLLREAHPEAQEIDREKLFTLLSSWEPRDAILAKAPLSRFYGYFCDPETSKNWASIWNTSEPLFLVASKGLLGRDDGKDTAAGALALVAGFWKKLTDSPQRAVRYAREKAS